MISQFIGQIISIKHLHNSVNGNPKYLIRIYKLDETIELRTKSDSMFAYAIDPSWVGKWALVAVMGVKKKVIVDLGIKQ